MGVSMTNSENSCLYCQTPDDIFVEEAQRCHNKYRAKHNVPPVTVSKDVRLKHILFSIRQATSYLILDNL